MSRLRHAVTAALLLIAPAAAGAQLGFSFACAPGVPGCTSLRFALTNPGADLALNSFTLSFATPGWAFTPGPTPLVGLYSATDSFGAFSGFTTIGSTGRTATIDFTENGFPFSLLAGGAGFLDLEASGGTSVAGVTVTYTGVTSGGTTISGGATGSVVPEPATSWLVVAGAGVVTLATRRRSSSTVRG